MKKADSKVIADSSGLFSLFVEKDSNYKRAQKISLNLITLQTTLIIPSEVFAETINTLGRKINHAFALQVIEHMGKIDRCIITDSNENIRTAATSLFKKQPKNVSFTDCLVMAFADYFETKDIFGFDESFRKNGYKRIGID